MRLVHYHLPGQGARVGLLAGEQVCDLTASGLPCFSTWSALLRASTTESIQALVREVDPADLPAYAYAGLDRAPSAESPYLLAPVDRQEVWAAGVTYAWSREARVREAVAKDVYVRVYEAERPELFFKSLPQKVVGPNDWVGLRGDSGWNVPEPELALVLNPGMQIVGYTVGNDVSSRDIEGENPLYLPQAKVYRHSCALGPAVLLAAEGVSAGDLVVRLTIWRDGQAAFQGETSTAKIHRSLEELAEYLGRYDDYPHGAVLLTGTGIVPGDEFTLSGGDEVSIEIEGIGTLNNPVRQM
ncbi:MAG: fumarylacetoacetate hydrolase family protein [Anaerolineae bacterium]|nr:fumarylacetoacetate hydrolase family protein [Anaerolineae bacterium]